MCFWFCCRRVGWVLHHQQSITTVIVCSLTCEVGQRDQTRYGSQTGGHAQRRRSSTENSTTCYSRSCQTCRSSASHPELVPQHPAYHSLWNGGIQKWAQKNLREKNLELHFLCNDFRHMGAHAWLNNILVLIVLDEVSFAIMNLMCAIINMMKKKM